MATDALQLPAPLQLTPAPAHYQEPTSSSRVAFPSARTCARRRGTPERARRFHTRFARLHAAFFQCSYRTLAHAGPPMNAEALREVLPGAAVRGKSTQVVSHSPSGRGIEPPRESRRAPGLSHAAIAGSSWAA